MPLKFYKRNIVWYNIDLSVCHDTPWIKWPAAILNWKRNDTINIKAIQLKVSFFAQRFSHEQTVKTIQWLL